jgi:peroxiredoxin
MAESPPPPSPAPSSYTPVPSASRRRAWIVRLLPFLPIVLALGTAFAYRSYQASHIPVAPQVGALAPDFSLADLHQKPDAPLVTLSRLAEKSPVILLFHRGVGCHYCYAFLSAIKDQLDDFTKAGLQVLALSSGDAAGADAPEFPFPLLFDPGDEVAINYGLLNADNTLLYGVFIVDQKRIVRFAAATDMPLDTIPDFLEVGRRLQHP